MSSSFRWFGLAAAIIVADQLTKWVVLGQLAPGEGRAVTGFFNLVLVFNRGAAFSFISASSDTSRTRRARVSICCVVLLITSGTPTRGAPGVCCTAGVGGVAAVSCWASFASFASLSARVNG